MNVVPIHGLLPAQFENLRAVIANNYDSHDELGFQFCVMQNGEPLIDIRSGWMITLGMTSSWKASGQTSRRPEKKD